MRRRMRRMRRRMIRRGIRRRRRRMMRRKRRMMRRRSRRRVRRRGGGVSWSFAKKTDRNPRSVTLPRMAGGCEHNMCIAWATLIKMVCVGV